MSKDRSVKYYQITKEDYKKKARERYKNLSEYEDEKLVEYRKIYYNMRKNALLRSYKKLFSFINLIFS